MADILRRARRTLRLHGIPCNVSMKAFERWLRTPTPYLNPSFESIVHNPYLVLHELVEIAEIRRFGLRITRDINFRHADRVGRAHYRAARVEFAIAAEEGAIDHLRRRLRDAEGWIEDPAINPWLRERYRRLVRATRRTLRQASSRPALSHKG